MDLNLCGEIQRNSNVFNCVVLTTLLTVEIIYFMSCKWVCDGIVSYIQLGLEK